MLGSRLARRIVLPVLILLAALFALLGWAAVRVAEGQVAEELDQTADRVARTLDELRVPRERWPQLLPPLAAAVGAEIAVDGISSRADWPEADLARLTAGTSGVGGTAYRVLARAPEHGPGRYLVLVEEERIAERRSAVLRPVIWTGVAGLLVAVLLGVVVARTIARPVRRLAEQARAFQRGDAAIDAGPRGPGEIGELQEAFARMVVAIREGEARLRESERFAALGRLAGGIAHELRNPLTAIRMAVETATPDQSEARAIAVAEIERLDRTLREMLDYVRPRKPELVDVPLRTLFDDIRQLLGPQCEHLKVALEIEDPGDASVRADPDRVKQALINLVLNAAQAQPYGGSVRLRAAGGAIEVADEGPGVADEVRESLLQPFVTTKEAGIGLGLAVVKQVADEHGGELSFESGAQGTTFRLAL
ncbi:MAG: sensor histidine kinase [Planctomycetota bacterium]